MFDPESALTAVRAADALKKNKKKAPPTTPPSRRSQEIFHRVVIDCQRQAEVAKQLGISASRVCQIVRRVRDWLARGQGVWPALAPGLALSGLSPVERHRLDHVLAQSRHQDIYEKMMREVNRQLEHPQQITIRTESKPRDDAADDSPSPESPAPSPSEVVKTITTVRQTPLNIQLIKAAQRSALELERLADREPPPEPQPEMPSDSELFGAVGNLLYEMRRRAEQDGHATKSTNLSQLINNLLSALLGKDQGLGGGFFELDDSIRELVRRFVISPFPVYPKNPEPEQLVADVLSAASAGEDGKPSEPFELPRSQPFTPAASAPVSEPASEIAVLSPGAAQTSDKAPGRQPGPAKPTEKEKSLTPHNSPVVIHHLFEPVQLARVFDPWSRDF